MWTIRIRWKWIYQAFVCSWKGHDWDRFHVIHPVWTRDGHFCRRCAVQRPAMIQGTERTPEGTYMWYQYVDPNGVPTGPRRITASNIPGMKLT